MTARARRAEQLRSLHRRLTGPRGARPFPPTGSPGPGQPGGPVERPMGPPSGRMGGRHSTHRSSSDEGTVRPETLTRSEPGTRLEGAVSRGYRAAALGLALSGVLVMTWAFAGTPLPGSFQALPGGNPETLRESAPATLPPTTGAADVPPDLQIQLASPDPAEAVHGLARLRSLAFSSGNFRLLEQVNAPASSAAEADGLISARLRESGRVLTGFSTVLSQVSASRDSGSLMAVVAVSAGTSAYQERDAAGVVLADGAAVAEQRLRLVLLPVEGRWRIQDILPADDAAGAAAVSQTPGASGG